jgi:hypothetical protein
MNSEKILDFKLLCNKFVLFSVFLRIFGIMQINIYIFQYIFKYPNNNLSSFLFFYRLF